MKDCAVGAGSCDHVVGLRCYAVGGADFLEDGLDFAFVGEFANVAKDGGVGKVSYFVGFAQESNLVFVFDDSAGVHGDLEGPVDEWVCCHGKV